VTNGHSLHEHHQKRWYDHIANVTHAVYLSKQLPEPVQDMIARNLNEYIDTYRQLAKKDKNAISMGANRVLGLYKAKYGHRWYDPDTNLGRAFNMMAMVPEHFLEEYAGRIIEVANYIIRKQQRDIALDQHEVTSAVKTMLDQSYVSLREGDSGFRLVGQSGQSSHGGSHVDSHVVAVGEPMLEASPRVIRHHKKHRR